MAYIKPKLVTKNLFSKVVYDCILRNLYWFDNTPGKNHLKIKKTFVTIVFVIHFSYTSPGNISSRRHMIFPLT